MADMAGEIGYLQWWKIRISDTNGVTVLENTEIRSHLTVTVLVVDAVTCNRLRKTDYLFPL